MFELTRLAVGPWPMNCYLLRCPSTGDVAVVDPGADAQAILDAVGEQPVSCILLTHAHPDHIGALDEVRQGLGAPVGLHPADAEAFSMPADFPLLDGIEVEVGDCRMAVAHVPGHTPGSVCFRFGDQALVGDAIFPGGPGHTDSPAALALSLVSLGTIVFRWPDEVELLPGHGPSTTVGAERPAFDHFLADFRGDEGVYGDVTWS